MRKQFPSGISEQLGYYVYLYINPISGLPFYVGKGQSNRIFQHLREEGEAAKHEKIKEIREAGLEPELEILVHGLDDEETALRIEAAVIDLIGKDNLTNDMRGWRSASYGRMTIDDIIAVYDRTKVIITEPSILIRVNQLYHYEMSDLELYEATRGVWVIGERREKARLAFAVFEGVVREVYEIVHWFPGGTTEYFTRPLENVDAPDRWEFVGRLANEEISEKYRLKAVDQYFDPPSQNPIRYVNC